MPEWLIWMVAIWFIFGFMGRGCSWGRRRLHRVHGRRSRHLAGVDGGARLPRTRTQSHPAPEPKETPEERIRRRFVEGRTTLDEYEAELWEEIRPKG